MTTHIMSALTARRAELVTEAKAADRLLERLLEDIEHIDGALRTYDPKHRPRKPSLTRAKRVDLSRMALDVLRQATAPMTLRDLLAEVLARSGRQLEGKALVAQLNRLRTAMTRQRRNGVVCSLPSGGQCMLWEANR